MQKLTSKLSVFEKRLLIILLSVPLVLLSLGIYHGLMQTLYRSGMISQKAFAALDFYQGLTLHGVINAIVLTTFFAVAFGHACVKYYLNTKINVTTSSVSAAMMLVGTLMAAWAMLAGKASVLYTFYPPLKAHPIFYIGAVLLVAGSWVAYFGWVIDFRKWRKKNKTTKIPLAVLGTLVNFTIWFVCSLSVAYELLFLLLPWSLGLTETVNVPLARTLFWFFGHALVYFWLLPVYTMYYTMLPKLAGGKLYSDNAGRLVFFLFLIFSIPVGVHHQFGEPSITRGVKLAQSIMTFGVAVPSFITAFTIAASLEYAVWLKKGRSSWTLKWMFDLPYFDKERYLFAYLICGLILFIFGGLTGLVNASYALNNVVHNTSWVPGHFHMTVAGPVFLGIIGMSLYLLQQASGKPILYKKLATIVPYLWTVGLLTFSTGLMASGLMGAPRRTNMGLSYLNPDSPLYRPDWVLWETLGVIGGCMMFASAGIYFLVLGKLIFTKKSKEETGLSFPEYAVLHDEPRVGILDNFRPWLVIMGALIVLAYIPALRDIQNYTGPGAKPYDPSNPIPLELTKDQEDEDK